MKQENFMGQDDSKSDSKDNTNININIQNQKFQVIYIVSEFFFDNFEFFRKFNISNLKQNCDFHFS